MQEEYGLRCMIVIASGYEKKKPFTIPEISQKEEISEPTVAKILRILRINGFLKSERGYLGGYILTKSPREILVSDLLKVLGGRLYEDNLCEKFGAINNSCIHIKNCKVRSLWQILQEAIDTALKGITLEELSTGIKQAIEIS